MWERSRLTWAALNIRTSRAAVVLVLLVVVIFITRWVIRDARIISQGENCRV